MWFIALWTVCMVVFMAIGGFFMFRKFLKKLPKDDGRSIMDWEEYYVEQTKHMWSEEQRAFLEELVAPVPHLFRDLARHKIAGKIGELALKEKAKHMSQDLIIRGYIIATPKKDHKWLIKTLERKQIDLTPYQHLFDQNRFGRLLQGQK
jgi:divalent metal cation (Fe/Co/Zn/Cd) transporter